MKNKIKIFSILFLLLATLTSCNLLSDYNETTNNITNKVTEVEDFTIGDFQVAMQTAIEKAEASAIAIVHSEGGWMGSSSLGSGVVLKRTAILKNTSKGEVDGNIERYDYLATTKVPFFKLVVSAIVAVGIYIVEEKEIRAKSSLLE